jgi:purine-binding chemotaxis protein CheW
LDIAGQDIEEAPQFDAAVDTDFILGMAKIGDSVKILLDINKVLAGAEAIARATQDTLPAQN